MKIVLAFLAVLTLAHCAHQAPQLSESQKQGIVAELRNEFSPLGEPTVRTVGQVVLVQGCIDSRQDFLQIGKLVEALKPGLSGQHNLHIQNLVTLSPRGQAHFAREVQQAIGHAGINAQILNQTLILEGIVENDFEADRAVEYAKAFLEGALPLTEATTEGRKLAAESAGARGYPLKIVDILRITPRQLKRPR